jgi:type IV pilus assembly protein PilE
VKKKVAHGFTLIELLIVVAVIGILAAIAIPSYLDYVRKSRRSDALTALGNARLAQEKYRANNSSYGTAAQIAIGSTSPDGYYNITVSNNTSTTYTITADPTGAQAGDSACDPITVNETGVFSPAACARR